MTLHKGRIVAAHGRHYVVERTDGEMCKAFPKGKKSDAAVGDYVEISLQSQEDSRIENILPRRNLLYRSDEMRSKQFAANVDQLLIVVAVEPTYSDDLIGRALAGAWSADISPVVILNKIDIEAGLDRARQRLKPIEGLGVPVLECRARDHDSVRQQLVPFLQGKTSLLLGQSGMGKSTLLNALVPTALAATREHSTSLDMGKHTTTSTQLYHVPGGGDLIDSPGFQSFGLQHLTNDDIVRGFPEFDPYLSDCRFYNCRHLQEPDCAVRAAHKAGVIMSERYALYTRIVAENESAKDRY